MSGPTTLVPTFAQWAADCRLIDHQLLAERAEGTNAAEIEGERAGLLELAEYSVAFNESAKEALQ